MLDNNNKACVPCGLHKPLRNNYFDGKLLVSRDFSDEQDYHRGHRQMHNSLLHGTGTVCGLKIIQHPAPDCRDEFVVVESGMALDCCGQEIIVPERMLVRVREMLEADGATTLQQSLDGSNDLIIALRRCDQGAEPMPIILPGCDGEMGATQYGRICEGFEFALWSRPHTDTAILRAPARPKFDWVHTITLGAQAPTALHVNDGEHLLQIAADNDAGGAHLYAHSLQTHDLVSMLEGPEATSDTGSAREARLIFAAGGSFPDLGPTPGIGVWRAVQIDGDALPSAVLGTDSDHARIAISPTSGALFVLDQRSRNRTRLVSYSAEAINTWLASSPTPGSTPTVLATLNINQNFGDDSSAYRRGASMMQVSHDGRFLAILAQNPRNASTNPLYLIDISAFNAGGMDVDEARVTSSDLNLSGDEIFSALVWSIDDAFLYILSTNTSGDASARLNRYAITGNSNTIEKKGRGVAIDGNALDLALAPTETRAYLLLLTAAGKTMFTSANIEQVKALNASEPEEVVLPDDAVEIDGSGRNMTLVPNGSRAYVAAADAEPAGLPKRGLVAVIDITENDCAVYFDTLIDGCVACGDDGEHAVILGHVENYVFAAKPKMMNAGEAGDDDARIDNLSCRQIVPSASTLKTVVDCILEQGIAEGPPGPRGDPGNNGADGPQGDAGIDGSNGIDGTNGSDGLPGEQGPAGPRGARGARGLRGADAQLPEVNPIVGMSWTHAQPYPGISSNDLPGILRGKGIALAFGKEVAWKQFVASGEVAQATMLVELQRRVPAAGGAQASLWAALDNLLVSPISDFNLSGTLLTDWNIGFADAGNSLARGFAITADSKFDTGFNVNETLRLVFYTDFVVDESGQLTVDGSHLGGRLPTGRGAPGDTFRSWFTFNDRADRRDRTLDRTLRE